MMRYAKRNLRLSSLAAVMAAVALMLALSCATDVDAAAVVGDACSYDVTNIAVDVSMTGTQRSGDESWPVHMEWRFNDGDSHWTIYDTSDSPDAEAISLDSALYVREKDDAGTWGPWVDHTPPTSLSSGSGARGTSGSTERAVQDTAPPTFCGFWPLEDVEYLGRATIGAADTSVRHFKISLDHTDLSAGAGSYETYQYWIDSSGKMLQASMESLETGQDDYINLVATYSGFGETNVITAPTIPEE